MITKMQCAMAVLVLATKFTNFKNNYTSKQPTVIIYEG